ncbi:glycosyltransferase [bacterium]|nr:glycosyltransferase [bacterium]
MKSKPLWILLIRDETYYTTARYLECALQKEHNVISIGINPWYPVEPKVYPKKIKKLLKKEYHSKVSSQFVNFDLILVVDPVRQRFDFSSFETPTAYWAIDSHLKFDKHIKKTRVQDYDFLFVAQKDYVPQYREKGCKNVYWLPLACDPEIHKRHNLSLKYDLCFVGGLGPDSPRREIILNLQKEFNMFVGQRYLHDMARIYSQSKMVFDKSLKGDLNMRVFETLSCGRLLLTDRIDNGLEDLFIDKEHLVIYNDYEDLVGKARYYLEHPEERNAIARKGQEEVWKKHTYLHRARHLIETILKDS